MFQNILVDNNAFNIFYDTGCSDFISRRQAVKQLKTRAKQVYAGPIQTSGVGNQVSTSNNGIYSVNLPLANGEDATMIGVCMDKLTHDFPMYKLNGDVINDIHNGFRDIGGNPRKLPLVSAQVGGEVDFMIGIQYMRYHPKFVFQLPSGLTIFESHFKSADGSRGVIGGPHKLFREINQRHHNIANFASQQLRLYSSGYYVNPDAKLLGYPPPYQADVSSIKVEDQEVVNKVMLFEAAEHLDSEPTLQCTNCLGCQKCKDLQTTDETVSVQEEMEQDVIDRLVTVNTTDRSSTATLPLMMNPAVHLTSNNHIALKVYNQQMKHLTKYPNDKEDILHHVDIQTDMAKMYNLIQMEKSQSCPQRYLWQVGDTSYPRFKLTDGKYSCQLVFAKSQLVPEDMAQPRAASCTQHCSTHTPEKLSGNHFNT